MYADKISKIAIIAHDGRKAEMVAFANEHLKDNYVVVYKRTGDDKGAYKVEKPAITPVSLNRENSSDYTKEFMKTEAPRMSPEVIDYQKGIQKHQFPEEYRPSWTKTLQELLQTDLAPMNLECLSNY